MKSAEQNYLDAKKRADELMDKMKELQHKIEQAKHCLGKYRVEYTNTINTAQDMLERIAKGEE